MTDEPHAETGEPRTDDSQTGATDDDGWLTEGAIGALIVAGVVLFVVPEPATTGLGTLLIVAGVVGWVVNRFR
ncbi:hypothetical protein NGM10_14835 [Halorussus salilacus]|uniref:hypothetical protein n=1 Tax=Halorussus salilacus TaxID=2953750 RepID=UPI0020A05A80|nr:hypothetical protein [Halorussus salilacus]USZ67995.1 hypothetical protein NGM10_14835 [Halorussus salilacus]